MANIDSGPVPGRISGGIEQVSIEDLDGITDFLQPVYADTYPNDRGITKEMFENDVFHQHLADYLQEKLSDPLVLLLALRSDGITTGTIGLHFDEDNPSKAEVWGFYVDPTLQGQGLGRTLWEDLTKDERVKAIDTFHLTVAKDSTKAIEFYEANGFKIVGEDEWDWPSWIDKPIKNQYWKMEKDL